MAAPIRRTLSPVPWAGTSQNGEACSSPSPLSKSSSCTQNYAPSGGLLSSLFASLDSHIFANSFFSQKYTRPLERPKYKGLLWRRALFHFSICFMVGFFIGFTPLVSLNMSLSEHQRFSFEMLSTVGNFHLHESIMTNVMPQIANGSTKSNDTAESLRKELESLETSIHEVAGNRTLYEDSDLISRKLLILVTPTYARPLQAYYLNRLSQTLKLVSPPLLWIVVEMTAQSAETADILRRSGVMYRHLVCSKNISDIKDRSVHQRNVALSHIETHRLDGIVLCADDDNIYQTDLFDQIRQIRRFGTWMVAKFIENKSDTVLEGPICNASQVIGWHIKESISRFHAEMSGFAFNSTILWDPKRWHRPTLETIKQLETVNKDSQASAFIEQVVEDESQMEGLELDCSRIMVWHLHLESSNIFYPYNWNMKNNLDVIFPAA